jgi:DNA-binding response OmpR family regulator
VRIAVVKDNTGISDPLIEAFTAHGHRATRVHRSDDLFSTATVACLDAVVLDTKLQGLPGIHVLQRLREFSDIPVIMLTPKGDVHPIIRSLRSGADDCVAKPPRPIELMTRLEAIMRRWMTPLSIESVVVTGDVRIDLAGRSVDVAGTPIALTRTEFDIAATLAESVGTAVSREYVIDRVWGPRGTVSRPLDVHVAALRAKLNRPGLITTIRGFGYRWGLEIAATVAAE